MSFHNGAVRHTTAQRTAISRIKAVQLTKDVFTKVEEDQVITTVEMCQARDFLICPTTIKTGIWPGALESATLKHYHSMQRDEDTGKLVLLVPDHKRAVVGPALIGMDRELEIFYKTYVERIRPQFGNNSNNLFVTTEGIPFKKEPSPKECQSCGKDQG